MGLFDLKRGGLARGWEDIFLHFGVKYCSDSIGRLARQYHDLTCVRVNAVGAPRSGLPLAKPMGAKTISSSRPECLFFSLTVMTTIMGSLSGRMVDVCAVAIIAAFYGGAWDANKSRGRTPGGIGWAATPKLGKGRIVPCMGF